MKEIKRLVDGLHLERFYNDFERNDDSYFYIVEIYAYKIGDVIYVGNRQIPSNDYKPYTMVKYDVANYWLNGNSDIYSILYRYDNTSNSLYDKTSFTGNKLANQKVLNKIKKMIIDACNTNFNVQILPENYDITEQIGKQIYEWKRMITDKLKVYDIDEMRYDLIEILKMIKVNSLLWHKHLILNNRFWFISDEDAEEKEMLRYNRMTTNQKALLIVMKEWLAMILNESHLNSAYTMHIDKLIYKLNHSYYKNEDLFMKCKSKFFAHGTAIKIILSLMYNHSTERQIDETIVKFLKWRNEYNKFIFNKAA